MNPRNFDELTKELAKSTSRRHALRTILTASIGGVVGLGAIRSVFGNKIKCSGGPSNSDCAHWCAAVFGPDTPAAGQCTSDAAHNRGACCQCGAVDPSSICCVRDSNGFCVGGTVVAGCFCDSSQCQTCDATTGTCVGCPPGQTCDNGQCSGCSNPGVCGTFQNCPGNPHPPGIGCFCGTTSEGESACWSDNFCGSIPDCTTSADCPANSVCVVNTCCGTPKCFELCSTDGPAGAVQRVPTGSGPTGSHL
jgi:hypothetical protein